MKNLLFICTALAFLLAGCNEKPAPAQAPTPQTSSADQAMQASKEEAKAAVDSAKEAASSAAAATKDADTAISAQAKQTTDTLVTTSKETADKAMTAAKETTHEAATATENAAKEVAASTAPTTIPDWIVMPKYDCRACHALDHKIVGPAWKDVAEKYKGDATAEAKLMEKVKKGGKGNWDKVTGGVAMPPHPLLSDADLKKVVDFVLSLAK